ncbi:hypothetical protein IHE33_15025 (plasmid) [Mycetohabitans endofungorum]|uniref:hypothetical protein n=1 Tax=Mycetohabitans endofungorum TaxID=417203 RepID=UPI0030CCA90A
MRFYKLEMMLADIVAGLTRDLNIVNYRILHYIRCIERGLVHALRIAFSLLDRFHHEVCEQALFVFTYTGAARTRTSSLNLTISDDDPANLLAMPA